MAPSSNSKGISLNRIKKPLGNVSRQVRQRFMLCIAKFNRALLDRGIKQVFGQRMMKLLEAISEFAEFNEDLTGSVLASDVWKITQFSILVSFPNSIATNIHQADIS